MRIQASIHTYEKDIGSLAEPRMFDPEVQRDMARNCISEVGEAISSWKQWRKAMKRS